jgi:cytochrome c biogenesis factor
LNVYKSISEVNSLKHQKIVLYALLLVAFAATLVMPCLAQNGEETTPIVTTVQAVWFLGCFVGSLVRLLLPVPRKSGDIKSEGWNQRFTATTIITIVLALVVTGVAFPMATLPEDFGTLFNLFWLAFAAGYGGNAALIEISEYLT